MAWYYDDWDNTWKDNERNWDDDDDASPPTLKERKAYVEEMIQFGKDNNRPDIGDPEGQILLRELEEGIKLEEENEALMGTNDQVVTDNKKVNEEIKQQIQELDDLIREIDEEVSDIERQLAVAENAKPRDEGLIVELNKRRDDLKTLREGCVEDRKKLNQYVDQSSKVSSNCTRISGLGQEVRTKANSRAESDNLFAGGNAFSASRRDDGGSRSRDNNGKLEGEGRTLSDNEVCDLFKQHVADLFKTITEVKTVMTEKVGEMKTLSADNTNLLKNTQEGLKETGQNIKSRREMLTSMRNSPVVSKKADLPQGITLSAVGGGMPSSQVASNTQQQQSSSTNSKGPDEVEPKDGPKM